MKRFSKSKLIKAMKQLKIVVDKYQNSLEKWCLSDWHPVLIEEFFMESDMKSALINVLEVVNKMDLEEM